MDIAPYVAGRIGSTLCQSPHDSNFERSQTTGEHQSETTDDDKREKMEYPLSQVDATKQRRLFPQSVLACANTTFHHQDDTRRNGLKSSLPCSGR